MVVTNTGGSALSNVSLTDQVNGMSSLVLTASPGSCSQSAGNVACNMPSGKSLAGGATWTVTIKGTVTAAAGTTLNNSATATATRSSTTFTASASASVQVTGSTGGSLPDLTVSINAPTSVVTNGSLPYTLTVNNIGAANATGVEVDDTLPAGVTFVNASGTSLFTCSFASPTVKCTGGAVSTGGNATITINTTAPGTTGSITDTAVVDPTCTSATESNCSNNSATFATTVTNPPPPPAPDLTITITAPTNVTLCNTAGCTTSIAYTLTVTNAGNATAPASILEVDDTLPAAITSATASGTGGYTCTVTLPGVKCTTGTGLDANASATIKINGTMPFGTATGTATDTAAVDPTCTSTTESDCSNNNASAATTLSNATTTGTLTLQATAATTADPNGTIVAQPVDGKITYTLVIHNTSSARADHVVLTDGTQGLDASRITATPDAASIAEGVTCVINAPQVTCSAGGPTWRINAGATATVTIVGNTVTQAGTQISATGTALIDTATVTGNIMNVGQTTTASVTTTVVPSIELNITQTSSSSSSSTANSAHAAADLVYTITVGNSGFYNANPVEVRVPLPAGVLRQKVGGMPLATFTVGTDYTTTGGFTCSIDASNVVDCTGGTVPGFGPSTSPAANTRTITLNLVAPETTGSISDTATVNPHNTIPESDYTDNSFALTTTITTGVDLCVPPDGSPTSSCPAASVVTYCPFLAPGPLDCSTTPKGVATASRLTYVIKVPNQGTQDTTGVVVQDTLPTGVTFISAAGDHNLLCSFASPTVTCTGGIINGTYTKDATTQYPTYPANFPPSPANTDVATITIVVFSVTNPGMMTNQISVDPGNAISEFDKTNNVNSLTTPAAYGGANPYIDLSITKVQKSPTATPNQVAQNGTLTYELTISNDTTANPIGSLSLAEEQTATHVVVKDFVPAGARFISVTAAPLSGGSGGFQCSETPLFGQQFAGELDCNGGTVAPGGSTTIDVTMFAPPAGTYTTQATTQALDNSNNVIAEGDATNNSAQITTVSKDEAGPADNAYIDLALTMTADHGVGTTSPPAVTPGGAVVYTLTVTNNGSNDATNVEVKDTLPGGSTMFVSASDASPASPGAFSCSQAVSGTVDCTGGTVTGGGGTRKILIKINAPNSSADFPQGKGPNGNDITILNQAIVNPSGMIPESTLSNNTAQVTVTVHSNVDLSITKTGPSSATQSSNQTYVLTVTNNGTDAPTCGHPNCVEVIDPLPVGMIIQNSISFSPANSWQCSAQQNPVNVVDCVGDLTGSGGSAASVTITVPVFITATDGATLDNQACVDPKNVIVEFDETNNCSTSVTSVVAPPFVSMNINKTAGTGTVTPGGTETYTLVVSNNGTGPAAVNDITVTDNLPAGMSVVGSPTVQNGFTCSGTTVLTCSNTGAALANGSSATITFMASVPTSATGQITNTASVTAADDVCACSPTSSATVNVGAPTIDMVVTSVTGTPGSVAPPQDLVFTVSAQNKGTGNASGTVHISNTLNDASQMSLVGASGINGWTCGTLSGATVDCQSAGTGMPAGASTTLTLKFAVTAGRANPIILTSTIDPTGTFQPASTPNNSGSATISVSGSAACTGCKDVLASIFASPEPVTSGGTINYTASVLNVGDQNIQNTTGNPGNPALTVFVILDSTINVGTASFSATGPNPVGNAWTCQTATSFFLPSPPPVYPGANAVVCTGDLPVGQGATITVSGTTTQAAGMFISTKVDGDGLEALTEPASNDAVDEETETTGVN
jgi:uncharacterized repeat protein (TIGR01451 family)